MGREKRRFEIVDNRNEVYTATGGKPYLRLPSGLAMFKAPKSGTFRLDFIPFEVTAEHLKYVPTLRFSKPGGWYWERTVFIHEGVGPDNQKHLCAMATYGQPCPMCETRTDLRRSPHKEDRDRAYDMRPREDQVFLVQPRNERTQQIEGPLQLWDVKNYNFGKQLDDYKNNADQEDFEAYRRFFDPDEGYTVKILGTELPTGSGGGKYTSYSVLEFKQRREPLPEDLISHGYDLDAMIRPTAYEALKRIFTGTVEDEGPTRGELDRHDELPPAEAPPPPARPQRTTPPQTAAEPPARERAPQRATETKATPAGATASRKPAAPPVATPTDDCPFQEGDYVRFQFRGRDMVGTVAKINHADKLLHAAVEGAERDKVLEWDEPVVISAEEYSDAMVAQEVPASPPPAKPPAAARPAASKPPRPASPPPPPAAEADPNDRWADDGSDQGGDPEPPPPARPTRPAPRPAR